MKIIKISSKGQITLPHSIMVDIKLMPYDKVLIEQQSNSIVLKPLKKSVVDELAGSLNKYIHPSKLGRSFDEIMEETKKKVVKHLVKKVNK
jgi:bifunctional DNA-binding transcriptional regulator/antitoxin component of YhaV-PrlF toxin-antitoxin module